jgi:hypothetical protein
MNYLYRWVDYPGIPNGDDLAVFTSSTLALVCIGRLCVVNVGCALTQEVSKTPRNATEQLLLSQALDWALVDIDVPIPEGEPVQVEVSGLQTDRMPLHLDEQSDRSGVVENPSWDLAFVRDMTTGRLGKLGYRVQISQDEARYLVRVLVQTMGTNQGKTFYGVPSIQSVVIPFSLPQITLYQKLEQLAHVRLHLDIFEAGTGRFSDPHLGQRETRSTTNIRFSSFFPSGGPIWSPLRKNVLPPSTLCLNEGDGPYLDVLSCTRSCASPLIVLILSGARSRIASL